MDSHLSPLFVQSRRFGALEWREQLTPIQGTPSLVLHESGYEGNRLVLVATEEYVIPSLPLFARYRPVPFITLPTSTTCNRQIVQLSPRLERVVHFEFF